MVVESPQFFSSSSPVQNENGQSVIEFVFSLPLIMGMLLILIKINTAIQMSIVNQQHSRAQALVITYNSPIYPELFRRYARFQNVDAGLTSNHMVVGVSDNVSTSGGYSPRASTQGIVRQGQAEPGPIQAEPEERKSIRIRSSVTLCTQSNVTGRRAPLLPDPIVQADARWSFPQSASDLDFCSGVTRFDPERGGGGG